MGHLDPVVLFANVSYRVPTIEASTIRRPQGCALACHDNKPDNSVHENESMRDPFPDRFACDSELKCVVKEARPMAVPVNNFNLPRFQLVSHVGVELPSTYHVRPPHTTLTRCVDRHVLVSCATIARTHTLHACLPCVVFCIMHSILSKDHDRCATTFLACHQTSKRG